MSKLLKFKEHVTVPEAIKHLTKMLGEEVTVDDIAGLIIDGHLTASVIAKNWAVYIAQEKNIGDITVMTHSPNGEPDDIICGTYPISPEDALVPSHEGVGYLQLELSDGSIANCYEIRMEEIKEITHDQLELQPLATDIPALDAMKQSFEQISALADQPIPGDAHKQPSTELDKLVIRTCDLLEFVAKANDDAIDKPLDYRERESMERIILALAKDAGYDLSEPFKAAVVLQAAAARVGVGIPKSKDTIADKLKGAARHETRKRHKARKRHD